MGKGSTMQAITLPYNMELYTNGTEVARMQAPSPGHKHTRKLLMWLCFTEARRKGLETHCRVDKNPLCQQTEIGQGNYQVKQWRWCKKVVGSKHLSTKIWKARKLVRLLTSCLEDSATHPKKYSSNAQAATFYQFLEPK